MRRPALAGVLLCTATVLTAGCTADPGSTVFRDTAVPGGSFQLVAFDSCEDALGKLREAAKRYVGPYGFGYHGDARMTAIGDGFSQADNAAGAPAAPGMAGKAAEQGSSYSGTNAHEKGADEPDLVKTDGRRIITIARGVLRVVDARSRQVTGELDLVRGDQDPVGWSQLDLLLAGDHALVLSPGGQWVGEKVIDGPGRPEPVRPDEITGPRLLLVDLGGATPRLASSYTVDGQLVDARQTGTVARVVVRSQPRLAFRYDEDSTDAQRTAANRAVIDRAGPEDWLPRYELSTGQQIRRGRVDCAAVSRPTTYTGTSLTTVLSFDLGRSTLSAGDPVTVVADGDTVYSNGTSLYVANDQRWRVGARDAAAEQRTELFKFDLSGSAGPRYVAAGAVPGWLVNQYALSEWDGHLRVATTTGQGWGRNPKSESAVHVLRQNGKRLVETGRVTGLGKGERIYSVRFTDYLGYVVTFRQTDPLYTLDLRNPAAPAVLGELKITGYSAYLHPVGDTRLIGIGQEATAEGRVRGTQVSLFDVSDLTEPRRLAQHHVRYGYSEAEYDPHAFLYWPPTGLLVVPLMSREAGETGALVLTVGDRGITEAGRISHPSGSRPFSGQIRRSLVIDGVLWTVSDIGLAATDPVTLGRLAWIEF